MRGKGITYDTGFVVHGVNSRQQFEPKQVERELRIIRDDLRCTCVRVIGGDPDRLEAVAGTAVDLGLEVWFSPYPLELGTGEMLALFADCAARAERLRRRGGDVVLVTGAELSLMNPGFLPGDTLTQRLALVGRPEQVRAVLGEVGARVNDFLGRAVDVVRQHFAGKVTYAAVPIDRVDWTPFDIVSMDVYRSAANADQFAAQVTAGVRELAAPGSGSQGKPVAITEFGTASYRNAGDRGALGLEVIEFDEDTREPLRLNAPYERDEDGQAAYLRELLEVFDAAGIDSTFVFAFSLAGFPHRPDGDPRNDLDLASYSIVKLLEGRHGQTYPDMAWEPKAAFTAVADYYGSH